MIIQYFTRSIAMHLRTLSSQWKHAASVASATATLSSSPLPGDICNEARVPRSSFACVFPQRDGGVIIQSSYSGFRAFK